MRVIKEGLLVEKQKKCSRCGTIFAYTKKDVDFRLYATVSCPICGNMEEISMFDKKVKE